MKQHHPHGRISDLVSGSQSHKSIERSKSNKELPSLHYYHQYGTSSIINPTESSYRSMKNDNEYKNNGNNNKKVNLEIISRETIKPASPTPHHLRTFNLSYIDQWLFDCYTPLVFFLPKFNKASGAEGVVKHLKKSLSAILTPFYPFAGEVKDDFHIECNDKGVNFMVARVNQSLKEFLHHPDDKKVRELLPESPRTGEPSIGNHIIGVQVNIFSCGGIGLCTSVTHKLFDGHTYFLFMKAWAAAATDPTQTFSANLMASEVFPSINPSIDYSWPSNLTNTTSNCTKRFLFDSNAIASLKAQLVSRSSKSGPTRKEATTAVIWKAAAKASSAIKPFGPQSPHALLSNVNLRNRASPPLPNESIGNLFQIAVGICYPESQPNLLTLIGEIRESIAKINSDHIESLKGEQGHKAFNGILRRLKNVLDVTEEGDRCLFVTSILNNGVYDIDFGWGKPIWFYHMNAGFTRIVSLTDALDGGGVEATITLSCDEMEIFERDPELLSYATIDTKVFEDVRGVQPKNTDSKL